MSTSDYHRLTVKSIRDETADARSFVLIPERGESSLFHYLPGQFLTFRVPYDDIYILRSYSISSAPDYDPDMTICVKRVEHGRGSNWFNDQLRVGARIYAQRPSGRFTLTRRNANLFLVAGGSGITPCISLIKQALTKTQRKVKLLYANQHVESIIYHDNLNRLTKHYPDRFECHHWLDDKNGYLKPDDIMMSAEHWEDADFYICGPDLLMQMAEESLDEVCGEHSNIRVERFISPDDAVAQNEVTQTGLQSPAVEQFRITLDGEDHYISIGEDQGLLDAAKSAGIEIPHSCTEGHCGTCMSQLREGEVSMNSTKALSKRNLERRYILACQSRPSDSSPIWIDFDF